MSLRSSAAPKPPVIRASSPPERESPLILPPSAAILLSRGAVEVASAASEEDALAISPGQRVSDLVYERVRNAIVTGMFEPGARLVERKLIERLRVSRTPLREALKRLEQEGLVATLPNKRGWSVHDPSYDEARQAYELRRAAEGLCGELAAQRVTPGELQAMRDVLRLATRDLQTGDRLTLLLHNNALHHLQARAARNAFLERTLLTLWAYVDLLRGRWWGGTRRPAEGHDEHEAIVDALAKGDAALARRLNEAHVDRAWKNIAARF